MNLKLTAIVVGFFSALSCFAQGGGSVNGPDLQGKMIPVFADGEIPAENLNKALNICYIGLAEKVMGTILGRAVKLDPKSSAIDSAGNVTDVSKVSPYQSPAPIPTDEKPAHIFYSTSNQSSPDLKIRPTDSISIKPLSSDYYYSLNFGHTFMNSWDKKEQHHANFNLNYSFRASTIDDSKGINLNAYRVPFLSYQLKDKSIYGELGEVIQKKSFVSQVKYNFDPNHFQTVFPLYATREDGVEVETPIKLDIVNLIQCIQTNLAQ